MGALARHTLGVADGMLACLSFPTCFAVAKIWGHTLVAQQPSYNQDTLFGGWLLCLRDPEPKRTQKEANGYSATKAARPVNTTRPAERVTAAPATPARIAGAAAAFGGACFLEALPYSPGSTLGLQCPLMKNVPLKNIRGFLLLVEGIFLHQRGIGVSGSGN